MLKRSDKTVENQEEQSPVRTEPDKQEEKDFSQEESEAEARTDTVGRWYDEECEADETEADAVDSGIDADLEDDDNGSYSSDWAD